MSDGDDEEALDPDTLEARLDDAEAALGEAETEADLDAVDETVDEIEAAVEAADLPAEEDDDRGTVLADRLDELRTAIEDQRGPYAEDVVADVEAAVGTITDTRWTDAGRSTLRAATVAFIQDAGAALEAVVDATESIAVAESDDIEVDDDAPVVVLGSADAAADESELGAALEAAAAAIEGADLDPDADAETVTALADAAAALSEAVDGAQTYDDLTVREQLQAEGFYDSLGQKHKDFPPEWSALMQWEQRDNVGMVLLALEKMDSEFMERHCMESLERMGHPGAIDDMLGLAERRDKAAIRVLGSIGEPRDDVLETLHEFLDGDPGLQRVTLQSLGRIGHPDSAQPIANLLVADEASVRSQAARALGMIGDERAVEPLESVLGDADESPSVRASAAWALVQIGSERALTAAAEHAADRAYVVEAATQPAVAALDTATD